jgi:adsorption protein B
MPVRVHLGGFMPSNGVGTGFSRFALERLASADANRLFEPACLTEDYEIGFRLRMLNCLQLFVPVRFRDGAPVATRELFPTRFRPAVRQRTRWVTGIALQGGQRHGWQGGIRQGYWHWRDRKGLAGNTVSLAANLISLWGLLSWSVSRLNGSAWTFGERVPPAVLALLPLTLFFLLWRMAFKIGCTRRIYGTAFAMWAPLRALWANWINGVATLSAIHRFSAAWLRHEPLVWLKTEHRYPSKSALIEHKRPLGEILVMSHYITQEQLETAQSTKPRGVRIGEHLVGLGQLTEEELYEALSLQQSLPTVALNPAEIPKRVARSLPAHVVKRWQVLPFRIESGNIFLASPEVPSDEAELDVRRFTRLDVRFQLITPSNFRELQRQLLETSASGSIR